MTVILTERTSSLPAEATNEADVKGAGVVTLKGKKEQ